MITQRCLLVGLVFLAGTQLLRAESLVDWDFSSLPANTEENAAATNPLLPASAANAAAGVSSSDLVSSGLTLSTAVAPGGVGTAIPGELNLKNWDVGGDGTNDNYLSFTLSADPGTALDIDSLTISLWRNGGGAPNGIAWEASVDGGPLEPYGTMIVTESAGGGAYTDHVFTDAIMGASSVEFRFVPRFATAGSTGNLHIGGLSVEGSLVPEPSSGILALLGVASIMLRRRRR